MNSTALGASKLKDGIIFISEAHEKLFAALKQAVLDRNAYRQVGRPVEA